MPISLNFRDMYTSAYNRKDSSRDLLSKRYLDVIHRVNRAYDAAEKDIEKEYNSYRNSASAQSAISKANTAAAQAQKGLSKSGESIQSSILSDMALANTMVSLDNQEAQKKSQNYQNRMAEVSALEKDLIDAQSEADRADRELEYQKSRDAVKDEQWQKEFDYNASRANVSDYRWEKEREYQTARDAESDRQWNVAHAYQRSRDAAENDLKKQELARRIYENDRDYQFSRDKFEAENSLANAELELEKSIAANNNYLKSQYLEIEKKNTEKTSTSKKVTYSLNEDGYYAPNMTPNSLLNVMQSNCTYGAWIEGKGFITPKKLFKQRMIEVLANKDLDPGYREELLFLATARGVLE